MIREALLKSEAEVQNGFRLRGLGEVSRIEALSDGVIAFAITLLVVSLEVPRTSTTTCAASTPSSPDCSDEKAKGKKRRRTAPLSSTADDVRQRGSHQSLMMKNGEALIIDR